MMSQFQLELKTEFPHIKAYILGIVQILLGFICVIVSVISIFHKAWGYHVGTGIWGGIAVAVFGFVSVRCVQVKTAYSLTVFCGASVGACFVSIVMLVLSAGALTYKSRFYAAPIDIGSDWQKVTLVTHGIVLGVSILSVFCSLIAFNLHCCFMTHEKCYEQDAKSSVRLHACTHGTKNDLSAVKSIHINSRKLFKETDNCVNNFLEVGSSPTLKKVVGGLAETADVSKSETRKFPPYSDHHHVFNEYQHVQQEPSSDVIASTQHYRDSNPLYSPLDNRVGVSSICTNDYIRNSHSNRLMNFLTDNLNFDPSEEPLPPYKETEPPSENTVNGEEAGSLTGCDSNISVVNRLSLNIPVAYIGKQQIQTPLQLPPPITGNDSSLFSDDSDTENDSVTVQGLSHPTVPDGNLCSNFVPVVSLNCMERLGQKAEPAVQMTYGEDPEVCALTDSKIILSGAFPISNMSRNVPVFSASRSQSSVVNVYGTSNYCESTFVSQSSNSPLSQMSTNQKIQDHPIHPCVSAVNSRSSAFRPVGKKGCSGTFVCPAYLNSPGSFLPQIPVTSSSHHIVHSPVVSPCANARFSKSPLSVHHYGVADISESSAKRNSLCSKSVLPMPNKQMQSHSPATRHIVVSENEPGPAVPVSRSCTQNCGQNSQSLPCRQNSKINSVSKSRTLDNVIQRQFVSKVAEKCLANEGVKGTFNGSTSHDSSLQHRHENRASAFRHGRCFISSDRNAQSVPEDSHISNPFNDKHAGFIVKTNISGGNGDKNVSNGITCTSRNQATCDGLTTVSCKHSNEFSLENSCGSSFFQGDRSCGQSVLDTVKKHMCHSASCQANMGEGDIDCSMDRTHRWVLGTLPTSHRQGTTRNFLPRLHPVANARHSASVGREKYRLWDQNMLGSFNKDSMCQTKADLDGKQTVQNHVIFSEFSTGDKSTSHARSAQPDDKFIDPPLIVNVPGTIPNSYNCLHSPRPVVPQPIRPELSNVLSFYENQSALSHRPHDHIDDSFRCSIEHPHALDLKPGCIFQQPQKKLHYQQNLKEFAIKNSAFQGRQTSKQHIDVQNSPQSYTNQPHEDMYEKVNEAELMLELSQLSFVSDSQHTNDNDLLFSHSASKGLSNGQIRSTLNTHSVCRTLEESKAYGQILSTDSLLSLSSQNSREKSLKLPSAGNRDKGELVVGHVSQGQVSLVNEDEHYTDTGYHDDSAIPNKTLVEFQHVSKQMDSMSHLESISVSQISQPVLFQESMVECSPCVEKPLFSLLL